MSDLRGYIVSGRHSGYGDPAVLVFHHSAREAKKMGWRTIVDEYMCEHFYIDVRVRWIRESEPERWAVTEPCLLEPPGCNRCELWFANAPLDTTTGLCNTCLDDPESYD